MGFFAAFPALKSDPLYNLVDGDHVITSWTITAIYQAEWYGVKPTGRPIRVSGVDVLRLTLVSDTRSRGGRAVQIEWMEPASQSSASSLSPPPA